MAGIEQIVVHSKVRTVFVRKAWHRMDADIDSRNVELPRSLDTGAGKPLDLMVVTAE